jgi:hypothetical protein
VSRSRGPDRWDWRWARRGALLLGPVTALAALVHATVVLREPPVTALVHYALGAAYGALLGLAVGGLLSLLRPRRTHGAARHPSQTRRAVGRPHRRAWIAHSPGRRADRLTTTAA